MSAADLMAVLISKYLHYYFDAPENPSNDLQGPHLSPALFGTPARLGVTSGVWAVGR
jgi:transketolase